MNTIQNNKSVGIEEQACAWFACMLSDRCTLSDVAKHKAWIDKDESHSKAYREIEEVWALAQIYADRREMRAAIRRLTGTYHHNKC